MQAVSVTKICAFFAQIAQNIIGAVLWARCCRAGRGQKGFPWKFARGSAPRRFPKFGILPAADLETPRCRHWGGGIVRYVQGAAEAVSDQIVRVYRRCGAAGTGDGYRAGTGLSAKGRDAQTPGV